MIRIALVTNWGERCGVAEYAHSLVLECMKVAADIKFKIIGKPITFERVRELSKDCDIIHFNFCGHAYSAMDPQAWHEFKGKGKPVVMTFHESQDWWVRRLIKNGVADVIVVHSEMF